MRSTLSEADCAAGSGLSELTSSSLARCRIPRTIVVELLETGRSNELLSEIGRIVDDRRHGYPFFAEIRVAFDEFLNYGIAAVRDTVLSEIARREICRDHLEVRRLRRDIDELESPARIAGPLRGRIALQ